MFVFLIAVVAVSAAPVPPTQQDPLLGEICMRAPHVVGLLDNWCSHKVDVCDWEGVTCVPIDLTADVDSKTTARRVAALELIGVPLQIEMPLIMYASTQFRTLNLVNCGLTGDLGLLASGSKVAALDLSRNEQLSGFLSAGALQTLASVVLHGSKLTADIGELLCGSGEPFPHAKFDVSDNNLSGDLSACSGGVGQFDSVSSFNLSRNAFSGRAPVPRRASTYDVSHNEFTSLESVRLEMREAEPFVDSIYSIPPSSSKPKLEHCSVANNRLPIGPSPPLWVQKVKCEF